MLNDESFSNRVVLKWAFIEVVKMQQRFYFFLKFLLKREILHKERVINKIAVWADLFSPIFFFFLFK
jgi:hypothetical protein